METATATAGRVTVTVATSAEDRGQRRGWTYTILADGTPLHTGEDLSGVGDASEMLATLVDFLSAWAESVEYSERTGRPGENTSLFPASLWEIVGPEIEDLYLETHEYGE